MSEIMVEGVTKTYGDVTALKNVTFTVPEESTFGLLGTNGAGKTTLFQLLTGHQTPDSGRLEVSGISPQNGKAVRKRVGYLPEHAAFPGSLTGREILRFHAEIREVPVSHRNSRVARAIERVGLDGAADRRVAGYSKGMNRRLGLSTVLVAEPAVLLLDEPTSGLDPEGVDAFHQMIEEVSAETSVTIVFSSHTLEEVDRLCDRVAILKEGILKTAGSLEKLRSNPELSVTVFVWLERVEVSAEVISRFQGESFIHSINPDGDRLVIECKEDSVYDLLEKMHRRTDVKHFEVRRPEIRDVFRHVITSNSTSEPSVSRR